MSWIVKIFNDASDKINDASEQVHSTVTLVNSQEFITNSTILSGISSIHYVLGDIIFYEIIVVIGIGMAFTIVKLFLAILRIIRDIKQTALF